MSKSMSAFESLKQIKNDIELMELSQEYLKFTDVRQLIHATKDMFDDKQYERANSLAHKNTILKNPWFYRRNQNFYLLELYILCNNFTDTESDYIVNLINEKHEGEVCDQFEKLLELFKKCTNGVYPHVLSHCGPKRLSTDEYLFTRCMGTSFD